MEELSEEMGSAKAMEKVHGESRDHRMRYVITIVYLNLHMCIYVSTSINIYIYIMVHEIDRLVGWFKVQRTNWGAPPGSNRIQSWISRDPNMESAGPLPQ